MHSEFRGIIAPVTTPFDSEGRIAYDALEENVARYMAGPLAGLLVTGTTGEAAHLSVSEKVEIARLVRGLVPPGRRVMAGVSGPSLAQAVDLVEKISELEIDALLAGVPSYYRSKMTDEALEDYFTGLAERSPFPLLLYNIPKFSGIELSPSLLERLAEHPGIVGMKESSGNLIYLQKVLQATAGKDFQVISGSAETFVLAHSLGVRAGILAVSCALPELMVDVFETCESRGSDLASKQSVLFRISSTVVGALSVPGVKYAMDLRNLRGMSCRLPLRPLDPGQKAEVEKVLQAGLKDKDEE